MDVVQDMKGQFYFLSIVIYAVVVGVIAFVLIQPQPPLLKPLSDGIQFDVYNLENEMEQSFGIGMALASGGDSFAVLEDTLTNYTRFTRDEIGKRGISVSWRYDVGGISNNATLNYSVVIKSEKVKFSDSFSIHKALLLIADSWYSGNYSHVNLTVHNETGRLEGLGGGAFNVLVDTGSVSVQAIGGGYYGNLSGILSSGSHSVYANVTDVREIVARATDTFTIS